MNRGTPPELEDELEFDLIDRLHKSLRVSGHDAHSLSRVLGVHEATIRNYLSGRTHPPRGMLIGWAFAVDHGVTVEWLETGDRKSLNPPRGRQAMRGPSSKTKSAADRWHDLTHRRRWPTVSTVSP